MAELKNTKDVVTAVAAAIRAGVAMREGGVQPSEITQGLAPGPFKDALDRALEGVDLVDDELLRAAENRDWKGTANLVAHIANEIQGFRGTGA